MKIQEEVAFRQRRCDYAALARELENQSRLELRDLSDLAWMFLVATNGNRPAAADLMDRSIDLLLEGGVLSIWRYRTVPTAIQEGL